MQHHCHLASPHNRLMTKTTTMTMSMIVAVVGTLYQRSAPSLGHQLATWRKLITHSTIQSYFWHAQLRSDTRRVTGQDHWVRFWGGRLATSSSQHRTAFLRRCLVLDRPNMSEFMCNLFGTPEEKHVHSSAIRLISNAHKIHVGTLNKTHFNLQTVIFLH